MISIEMFAQQLDVLLDAKRIIAQQQETISCELVDMDEAIPCNDLKLLQAFADFNGLEVEVCELEPHPLRAEICYKVKYKDVHIIAYPMS